MVIRSQAEVRSAFCELSAEVGKKVFDFPRIPIDCLCREHDAAWGYQYDERVLEFIRHAVYRALNDTTVVATYHPVIEQDEEQP